MTTAFFLVVIGTMVRLAHFLPYNAKAMGALAIYSGAKLPRVWAFLVPLLAMLSSDLYLDWGTGEAAFTLTRASIYLAFALSVGLGFLLSRSARPVGRFGLGVALSLASSTLFFLITNFAVWMSPQVASAGHPTTPATLAGLLECYRQGLPFYRNGLLGDLVGMAVFFGVDWAVSNVRESLRLRRERPSMIVEWAE